MNSILEKKSISFRLFSAFHQAYVYFLTCIIALCNEGHLNVVSDVLPKAPVSSSVKNAVLFQM